MSISSLSNEIFTHLYEIAGSYGYVDLLRSVEFGAGSLSSKGQEGCCCCSKEEHSEAESKGNFNNKSANNPPPHYITRRRPINTTPSTATKSPPSFVPELPGIAHISHS